jgi:hypothetical protein
LHWPSRLYRRHFKFWPRSGIGGDRERLRQEERRIPDAYDNRGGGSCYTGKYQSECFSEIQFHHGFIFHDRVDSRSEIRSTSYSSNALQRRFQIQLADLENALRVHPWLTSQAQYFLVTRSLAFLEDAVPDPPH